MRAALDETLASRDRMDESGELALSSLRSGDRTARLMALGPATTWLIQTGRAEDAMAAARAELAALPSPAGGPAGNPGLALGALGSALLGRVPKIVSYGRSPTPRSVRLASLVGGRSLHFTGCSEFISALGRSAALRCGEGRWPAALLRLGEARWPPLCAPAWML